MLDLFIDTYYLSSVNINLMINYCGTVENFPHFLKRCKMDVSCFAIQLFIFLSKTFLFFFLFNPKRAGLFWPISQPEGGGTDSAPVKISETDRWNIKCVVLLDSYDPPESIGTKQKQKQKQKPKKKKKSNYTLYDVTVTS